MRDFITIVFLSLLLASPGWSSPLGASREVHENAKSDFGRLQAARSALEQAHESLASEIEALKSDRGVRLAPDVQDAALGDRLQRAKAMAAELAALDRRVTAARAAYVDARLALVTDLEAEIVRLQVSLSEVGRETRLARFQRLKALVEERRMLPAAPIERRAPVTLPTAPDGLIVSPEELRELVDETRDHAERVQAQLDQINARVNALKQRRRLLQAATDFQRDDSLFSEGERNRRVVTDAREGLPTILGPVRPAVTSAPGAQTNRPETAQGEAFDGDQAGASIPEPNEANAGDEQADPQAESAGASPSRGGDAAEDFETADGPPAAITPNVAMPYTGGDEGSITGAERLIRLGDAFDSSILEGDVDDLSPAGVEQQIRALMTRRSALIEKRVALDNRRRDLEQRAIDAP